MSAHRIGSQAWHDANPLAPTRGEANEDAALDARYPTPYTPGPLTDAALAAERFRRYQGYRDGAEEARLAGNDELARWLDKQAERWAG